MTPLTSGFFLLLSTWDVSQRWSHNSPGAGWSNIKRLSRVPKQLKMVACQQGTSAVIPTPVTTILQEQFINIILFGPPPQPLQKAKTREMYECNTKYGYRLNAQVLTVSDSQPCHVMWTKCGPREYSVMWCFLPIALLINLEMWTDPLPVTGHVFSLW